MAKYRWIDESSVAHLLWWVLDEEAVGRYLIVLCNDKAVPVWGMTNPDYTYSPTNCLECIALEGNKET